MRKILWILPLLLLWSCAGKKQATVSGKIDNPGPNSYIYIYHQQVSESKLLDSSKLGRNGSFTFHVKLIEPGFYILALGKSSLVNLLLTPGEKLKFEADAAGFSSSYTIKGSAGSDLVHQLMDQNRLVRSHLDSLIADYLKKKNSGANAKELGAIDSLYSAACEAYRKDIITFVLEHHHSLSSIVALYMKYNDENQVLKFPRDLQFYKIVSDTLSRYYPKSPDVVALKADFTRMMNTRKTLQLESMLKTARTGIPDIALPDARGDTIHLTSFSNKVVLLSFWNTNCKQCLMQNNDLMDLYKKFGKSGFVIFQVSVQDSLAVWKKSIRNLPWINVAENNPSGSYYCQLYNVQELPASFLINRQGTILGKNLGFDMLNRAIAGAIKK